MGKNVVKRIVAALLLAVLVTGTVPVTEASAASKPGKPRTMQKSERR